MAQPITTLVTGRLEGANVVESRRVVGDLKGYWEDEDAALSKASELLYTTQTWMPVQEGLEGAVLWGNTTLESGVVGNEFFMTRGHWHTNRTRCELCITVSGSGELLLMDESRKCRTEAMSPGSTHYVDGSMAHRTVNTGREPLVFLCAWPADCGHEYEEILRQGFGTRIRRSLL
jgi:glucose-6-phosphate isomerase